MVHDKRPPSLATTVLDLQRCARDPQSVLTGLVTLHGLLLSTASSTSRSVPGESPLSDSVKTLQQLLIHYLQSEEEIVWYLSRVILAWSRSSHRFKLEAGHIRIWKALISARATYPDSPRVLETSLGATASLFHGIELHQLVGSHGSAEDEHFDEMLRLLDRFDDPPARVRLLSPHYDFSRIVVLAMEVLSKLFASARVLSTGKHGNDEFRVRQILERSRKLLYHFLKNSDWSRTWLEMCRLQLQYNPSLALQVLFQEGSTSPSWCRQVMDKWREDLQITYDLATVFTQVFAVPHGSKILPATILRGELTHAMIHEHAVLDIMIDLLGEYSARLRDTSMSKTEVTRLQPVVLEIARSIRQFSSVPEMLSQFPNSFVAKKSLVPAILVQVESSASGLRTGNEETAPHHMRLLLELVLTLYQLAQVPVFARAIKSTETLQPHLAQISKRVSSIQSSTKKYNPDDAGDSDLPAVLQRELQKTMKAIVATPVSSLSRDKPISANRGLRRLPSSSNSVPPSRQSSITRTTLTTSSLPSSTHSLRRTPSSSSTASSSLVRTNSQRHL